MNSRLPAMTPIGKPPPTTLPYEREVGVDTETGLRAARVRAEAGDDLVEDEHRAGSLGDRAQLVQELDRLKVGPPALHRLDQRSRQVSRRALADDVERFRRAVVEHEHVLATSTA